MKGSSKKWVVIGIILGLFLSLLWWSRKPVEALTGPRLKAAKAKWEANGPSSYFMKIKIQGIQHGDHEIRVENKQVVEMRTGGVTVKPESGRYWNVEGLFSFIEQEMVLCQGKPEGEYFLTAHFHPTYGYPESFLRQVFGQSKTIEWKVLRFESQRSQR